MVEYHSFSQKLLTVAAILTVIIMVVGICGNFLTIVALLKCPKVRNVTAAFIISLCLADLIFCALVLPFSALRFIEGTWTHGDVLCKLIPFIQYGNVGVSLLCIAMITINRYVMIAHHNSYSKIYKKHWIAAMIAFCWLFSYGMQLPTLLGLWGVFDYDEKLGTCSILNDVYGRSSKTTLFVTAFLFPCLIIIASYTTIFRVVQKSELRLNKHSQAQNSILNNQRPLSASNKLSCQNTKVFSNTSVTSALSVDTKHDSLQRPTRVNDKHDLRAKKNEWRITKMVLAIFLSFLVCYLPITLAKVTDKNVKYPSFHIFGYILLYLSACINPIIYVIMNKQYRRAYRTVLSCQSSRILRFWKPTNSTTEKWKDIGLISNHNRTMASQMSSSEAASTSLNNSHLPMNTMDLTLQLVAASFAVHCQRVKPNDTLAPLKHIFSALPQVAYLTSNKAPMAVQQEDQITERQEIIADRTSDAKAETLQVIETVNCLSGLNIKQMERPKKMQFYGKNIYAITNNENYYQN